MTVHIREARTEDIPVLVEYNYNLAAETEDIYLNRETLTRGVTNIVKDKSKGIYFVYEIYDKVVGQLMITKEWSDWRNGEFWWIQSVYVNKEYRRLGIFKKLYEHVNNIVSKDESICGIRLYVERENLSAQNTYKSLGMEETHYHLYEYSKIKL
jgi:ribosomal protein S18 acetylase RimI-like enzyme